MAELLVADGWPAPDSPVTYLQDALPPDYVIVADPIVQRHPLDAVVVGPQGLFVLHGTAFERGLSVARNGIGNGHVGIGLSGRAVARRISVTETRAATNALQAFLRDEFPGLQPIIRHIVVFNDPDADPVAADTTELLPMTTEMVPDAIGSIEPSPGSSLLDPEVREALAVALRDRQLTASQRATQPFIFRSGGHKAWTIREVVAHMDRNPADGISHLRNGTLARWLSHEGAEHLAELARTVVHEREVDPQVPLETFLIGTGLVQRPRLAIQPPQLDFGYVLAGETASRRLRVRRAKGRGYLFGGVRPREPWLHVEPETFSGGGLDAIVTVDSEALLIHEVPYQTEILIESPASDEPVTVPVRCRIVGMPSPLSRYLVRPLAGALVAALPGAVIGWLFGLSLLSDPGGIPAPALPPAVWASVAALLWAIFGGIWAFRQPLAWPILYALRRWIKRMLGWGLTFVVLAAAAIWTSRLFSAGLSGASSTSLVFLALALVIIPSVFGEPGDVRAEAAGSSPAAPLRRRPGPAALLTVVILGAVLLAGLGWLGSAGRPNPGATVPVVYDWAASQAGRLESGLNRFIDRLYLRRYDRRAPAMPTQAAPASPVR